MNVSGVPLAGIFGAVLPTIGPTDICFNGKKECGHQKRGLRLTWPKDTASGVIRDDIDTALLEITKSEWFAGASLETRACGGDCSHETFVLEQTYEPYVSDRDTQKPEGIYTERMDENGRRRRNPDNIVGKYWVCTKTGFKPYDLAVNVCLIVAKQHLKDDIVISSDGKDIHWADAKALCQRFLGYGGDFTLGR